MKFVEMKFISKEKNKMASIRFQLILLLIELEAKKNLRQPTFQRFFNFKVVSLYVALTASRT